MNARQRRKYRRSAAGVMAILRGKKPDRFWIWIKTGITYHWNYEPEKTLVWYEEPERWSAEADAGSR